MCIRDSCKDILGQGDDAIVNALIADPGRYPLRLFTGVLESV